MSRRGRGRGRGNRGGHYVCDNQQYTYQDDSPKYYYKPQRFYQYNQPRTWNIGGTTLTTEKIAEYAEKEKAEKKKQKREELADAVRDALEKKKKGGVTTDDEDSNADTELLSTLSNMTKILRKLEGKSSKSDKGGKEKRKKSKQTDDDITPPSKKQKKKEKKEKTPETSEASSESEEATPPPKEKKLKRKTAPAKRYIEEDSPEKKKKVEKNTMKATESKKPGKKKAAKEKEKLDESTETNNEMQSTTSSRANPMDKGEQGTIEIPSDSEREEASSSRGDKSPEAKAVNNLIKKINQQIFYGNKKDFKAKVKQRCNEFNIPYEPKNIQESIEKIAVAMLHAKIDEF